MTMTKQNRRSLEFYVVNTNGTIRPSEGEPRNKREKVLSGA